MKVIIDTTFSGPLKSRLLGTQRDTFFNRVEAVVRALEDRGPYHKGEIYTFDKCDVFTSVRFSGICTITYSGKPDWDNVPYLGEIEYGPCVTGLFGRTVRFRITPEVI